MLLDRQLVYVRVYPGSPASNQLPHPSTPTHPPGPAPQSTPTPTPAHPQLAHPSPAAAPLRLLPIPPSADNRNPAPTLHAPLHPTHVIVTRPKHLYIMPPIHPSTHPGTHTPTHPHTPRAAYIPTYGAAPRSPHSLLPSLLPAPLSPSLTACCKPGMAGPQPHNVTSPINPCRMLVLSMHEGCCCHGK